MPELDPNTHERKLQARVATLEELLRAVEQTVVEQSDRLERSGAAQSHLAAIVQSSDAAIVSLALDFRIQTWNLGAERLFGYTREEAIGRNCADILFPPTQKSRALAEFFTDVETFRHPVRNARYFEETFLRKDGTMFEAALIASGIYDAAGQLTGVSGIVRAISEQRRKDRDLARLASIVESSEDAIISLGTDFRITSWNRGAERLLGFAASEAIGATIIDLYVVPELRDHALSMMRQDLATLAEHSAIVHQLEVPVRRKDGTQVEVSIAVSGIYGSSGKLVGMSNILRDITDRKRAERELGIMASIVNASDDAIIGFSRELKITSWNPAAEAT
jgi:PAS domain S-box-containing protein